MSDNTFYLVQGKSSEERQAETWINHRSGEIFITNHIYAIHGDILIPIGFYIEVEDDCAGIIIPRKKFDRIKRTNTLLGHF